MCVDHEHFLQFFVLMFMKREDSDKFVTVDNMEGGLPKADKTEFTECWKTCLKTPYVMRLALSAGIGGLLFGYDTGNFLLDFFTLCFFLV